MADSLGKDGGPGLSVTNPKMGMESRPIPVTLRKSLRNMVLLLN
jgi:hypothetical protein